MQKLPSYVLPIIFLSAYITLVIFLRNKIPQPEVLLEIIEDLYGMYGYFLVFFGGLLEAMFLVGFYVPGSAVLLMGAAVSRSGVVSFPIVLFLATLGLCLGYTINYFLGKYGWYHVLSQLGFEKGIAIAKERLHERQAKTMLIGYFYPSSAAFLSTAAGILHMPFRKFLLLSVSAQVFWNTLWGSLAYLFGLTLVEFFLKYFGFFVIAIVVLWLLKKYLKK